MVVTTTGDVCKGERMVQKVITFEQRSLGVQIMPLSIEITEIDFAICTLFESQ